VESLAEIVHWTGTVIEMMAVLVIAYASVEAFIFVVHAAITRVPIEQKRVIWLRFLRLLVVGLTFQLAADLVHIAIARGWEQLARVAVIAVLRTFLSLFLDRDMRDASKEA